MKNKYKNKLIIDNFYDINIYVYNNIILIVKGKKYI